MDNKKKYAQFCKETYVPIFSKPWWLDIVCGTENWDVYLCEASGNVYAAMPYYFTEADGYKKITKPMLTQNNGILFKYPANITAPKKLAFEERVINEVCDFIDSSDLDVYEQQYTYQFTNWLPFLWRYYKAFTRYTYVIHDTSQIDEVWKNITTKGKGKIKKGGRNGRIVEILDTQLFYDEHKKIFEKQGLDCPFSYDLFSNLVGSCKIHDCCKMMAVVNENQEIMSVIFLIWDEKSVYQLLGGSIPEYQNKDTYSYLIWEGIKFASNLGLKYDFEGSVIKRISKSFREFGGIPEPYFRIRKVFNEQIVKKEVELEIRQLNSERKQIRDLNKS